MGLTCCPVTDCLLMLHNIPEGWRPQLHHGESLKYCRLCCFFVLIQKVVHSGASCLNENFMWHFSLLCSQHSEYRFSIFPFVECRYHRCVCVCACVRARAQHRRITGMLSVTEFVFPPAFPAHTEKHCWFLLLRLATCSKFADPLPVLWYFKLTVHLNFD